MSVTVRRHTPEFKIVPVGMVFGVETYIIAFACGAIYANATWTAGEGEAP